MKHMIKPKPPLPPKQQKKHNIQKKSSLSKEGERVVGTFIGVSSPFSVLTRDPPLTTLTGYSKVGVG